jgi:ABC-2 type transport system permease protein
MSPADAAALQVSRQEPRMPRGAADIRVVRGAFGRLVASEISMTFRRRRNLALLTVIALAPLAIGVAVHASAPPPGSDGPQFLNQITTNGLFLVFTALTVSVPLLIPLLVGVVAGDSIAGEAGTGTLRYLLVVPVTRSRLLAAKSISVLVYVTAAIAAVTIVGTVAGAALFGLHGPTLLSGATVSLAAGLARTVEMAGYIVLSLTGFVAIGMFITTLTEVPIAAMAATLGVAIIASVLDSVPQLGSLRNMLFVHHWTAFTDILSQHVDWATLWHYLLLQLAYVVVFGSAAWARFTTQDVTS